MSVFSSQAEEQGQAPDSDLIDGGRPACRLQSGAVRAKWGDRMVLWHWCSKMLVCRSRQHSIYSKTIYGSILIKVLDSAMVCFQHGTSDCVMCASGSKSSHTGVFPQPACYLLANSCLNTTQAPIKIPKTKNYYSGRMMLNSNLRGCFWHECGEWDYISGIARAKHKLWPKNKHYNPCTLSCECVPTCIYTSVTSGDACVRAQHVCVLVWLVCFECHRVHVSPTVH